MNQTKKEAPAVIYYKVIPLNTKRMADYFNSVKEVIEYLSKYDYGDASNYAQGGGVGSEEPAYELGKRDFYFENIENPTMEDFEKAPSYYENYSKIIEIIGEDPEIEGRTFDNPKYDPKRYYP